MRRLFLFLILAGCHPFLLYAQTSLHINEQTFDHRQAIDHAKVKLLATLEELSFNPSLHPSQTDIDGSWDTNYMERELWTSGFFPGSLWYMYMITGDDTWSEHAAKWTEDIEEMAYGSYDHDTGFRIFNSFGNGYKATGNQMYYRTVQRAAITLSRRFNPEIGAIKSWDWFGNFPVIIDNLMNLELLLWVAKEFDQNYLHEIARSHAETTRINHIREDGSSYHIVDFDDNGNVVWKGTRQGYGPESAWTRGQAWTLYGYAMIYRYTEDPVFLDTAERSANYFIQNLPPDVIPPYDFLEPEPSVRTKDASAAAIAASGMLELYSITKNELYLNTAQKILTSLSGEEYSTLNSTQTSILKRSTIHRGRGNLGTSYADYYYLEAIVRYLEITGYAFPERSSFSIPFFLDQNFPNPFNNYTSIAYSVAQQSRVELSVYNSVGRKVKELINEIKPAGNYLYHYRPESLPAGFYIYVLKSNGEQAVKKMTYIK